LIYLPIENELGILEVISQVKILIFPAWFVKIHESELGIYNKEVISELNY
jgi:hypothetical protein